MTYTLSSKRLIYRILLGVILTLSLIVLVRLAPTFTKLDNFSADDFARFWTSGVLNLHGINPYTPHNNEYPALDTAALMKGHNFIILEPPWTISLFMPFGLIDYLPSRMLWLLISIISIMISAHLLWRIYSGETKNRWIVLLIAFIFAPTISVLEKGQVSGLVLLGVTGFLYFVTIDRKDWLAGAFLALASVKAQLIIILWIAVLFWIIQERRWIILVAGSLSLALLISISVIFNHDIFQQYISLLQNNYISEWALPTIGTYLRYYWLGLDQFWVQFVPILFGLIWFFYHWYRFHMRWNWPTEMPLILLVSMVCSPYMMTYDVVILLPAVLFAVLCILTNWKRWLSAILLFSLLLISIIDLFLHMKFNNFWFIWLVPSLFIWYLIVRTKYVAPHQMQSLST